MLTLTPLLALLAPLAPRQSPPQDLAGLYRAADGARLVLFPAPPDPSQTALIELSTGNVRVLFPVAEDEFAYGEALAVPEPLAGTLAIDRGADGTVRGLVRTDLELGREQAFERVALANVPASFANGDATLAGTLLLPEGKGPFPGIVMLHGSEPEPRGGNLGLALFLVAEGFATVIFDKRGVGESTGGDWRASFEAYAGDAAAGFAWLRARPEIARERVGYWGHSQGAWVAALAAARTKEAAFAVLECGGALDPVETTLWWTKQRLEAEKQLTTAEITALMDYRRRKYDVVAGKLTPGELEPFTAAARQERWFPRVTERLPDDPFWKANVAYDPRPALRSLGHCAVLALYAEHDDSTPTAASLVALRALVTETEHARFEVHEIEAANHGLFETKTGLRMEQELPELERFAPTYPPLLLDWLKKSTTE